MYNRVLKTTVQPNELRDGQSGAAAGPARRHPPGGKGQGTRDQGRHQARAGPRGTHQATFCHVGWKAAGQGPVIRRGCAGGRGAEGQADRTRAARGACGGGTVCVTLTAVSELWEVVGWGGGTGEDSGSSGVSFAGFCAATSLL